MIKLTNCICFAASVLPVRKPTIDRTSAAATKVVGGNCLPSPGISGVRSAFMQPGTGGKLSTEFLTAACSYHCFTGCSSGFQPLLSRQSVSDTQTAFVAGDSFVTSSLRLRGRSRACGVLFRHGKTLRQRNSKACRPIRSENPGAIQLQRTRRENLPADSRMRTGGISSRQPISLLSQPNQCSSLVALNFVLLSPRIS